MPVATRRDELLVDDLRADLRRLEDKVDKLTGALARIEATEKQAELNASEHRRQHEDIAARLSALESTRLQAQGAAKFAKVVWVGLGAIVTYLVTNYLGGVNKR